MRRHASRRARLSAGAAHIRIGPSCALAASAALVVLSSPAVFADPSDTQLAPVVVTATRTAHSSNEVPASIDSISSTSVHQELEEVNLAEDLQSVPGVVARNRQDYAQDDQISIRGFGSRAQFGLVGIRLYIDGVPATLPDGQGASTAFNLDTADRIEVLRGPFSALYGNSSGGVVQIFTADGRKPGQLSLTTMGGSYGTYRASLQERGSSDALSYDLGVTHFSTDGYRAHSHARRDLANGKWSFTLSPTNQLDFLANFVGSPEARDPQGLTHVQFEANPRQAQASAIAFGTRKSLEQIQGGLRDEQSLGRDASLQLSAYFGNRLVKQYLSTPVAAQGSPTSSGGVVDLHVPYFGADARLSDHLNFMGTSLLLTGGFSYDREDERRRGWKSFIGSGATQVLGVQGALARNEADRVYNIDEYAQAEWTPVSQFTATVGLRHDAVHFVSTDHFITAGNPDDSGQTAFFATTPVAGLLFRATSQLNVYASYGEGFDTPTFDELAYKPDGSSGLNLGLLPARTSNAEFGAKWRLAPDIWVNAAVFGSMTRHEIVVDSATGGRSTYQNVARARRSGVEFESSVRVAPRLHWLLSYTYLDAVFRTPFQTCTVSSCPLVGGMPTGQVPVAAHNRLPAVPQNIGYTALRWGTSQGFRAGINGVFLSTTPTNTTNTAAAPGYALLGLDAGYVWTLPHWQIEGLVRADNMLNTHYVGAVIINDTNSQFYDPGAGRSAYAGITVSWMN